MSGFANMYYGFAIVLNDKTFYVGKQLQVIWLCKIHVEFLERLFLFCKHPNDVLKIINTNDFKRLPKRQ